MSENKKPNNVKGKFPIYWIYIAIIAVFLSISFLSETPVSERISKDEFFTDYLVQDKVEQVDIVSNKSIVEVYLKAEAKEEISTDDKPNFLGPKSGPDFYFNIGDLRKFEEDFEAVKAKHNLAVQSDIVKQDPPIWDGWMNTILFLGLLVIIWMFMMRKIGGGGGPGGQIFNIGKSKAQLFDKNTLVKTNFNDVAGLDEAKVEIKEIVDFLKNPKKYTKLGAQIPRGALLVGPPGTGKTLLAKAVAGEAKVPFFSMSGSDFVEMFVGVGASRVRDLFKQAKEKAPCIIFIDEIDAVGRSRGKNNSMGSNDERENTLNQLLTEMDGFETNNGIIMLAATNRADVLDKALMRPGRFDRTIFVDMPDLKEREAIFKVHLNKLKLDDTVDVEFLARQTPGFSGADIANICNEAALIAARKDRPSVTKQDFLDAVDRIIGGLEKKNKIITPKEKKTIAYHEAGHATVSWLTEFASPLVKVTIVPRGQSLGAAWYLPEERQITTKAQILDEMCAALGGRAAEEIIFGEVSTGALSDLEKVTKQAYAMISVYGLNDKLGNISYYDSSGNDNVFSKPYSEKTAELIDQEVQELVQEAYKRTLGILADNKDKLTVLADKLLEKEVIFKEDLQEIFGNRPYEEVVEVKEEETKEETPAVDTPAVDTPVAETEEAKEENTTNNDESSTEETESKE